MTREFSLGALNGCIPVSGRSSNSVTVEVGILQATARRYGLGPSTGCSTSRDEAYRAKTAVSNEKRFPDAKTNCRGAAWRLKGVWGAKIKRLIPWGVTSPKMASQKLVVFAAQAVAVAKLTYSLTITGGNDQR